MRLLEGATVVAVGVNASFQADPDRLLVTDPDTHPPATSSVHRLLALPHPDDERVIEQLTVMVAAAFPNMQLYRRRIRQPDGSLHWQVVLSSPASMDTPSCQHELLAGALLGVIVPAS